jgi:type II secretory pathway pseudopilin PulG
MIPRDRFSAFTLIELLAGVAIFTGILAALLAVTSSLWRTERFRDDNVALTQAASYAYEPILRAIKASDAEEKIYDPRSGACVIVRGYYVLEGNATPILEREAWQDLQENQKLVTIDAEPVYDEDTNLGSIYKWVRREYSFTTRDANGRAIPQTLKEKVVEINSTAITTYAWPRPLTGGNCTPALNQKWADNAAEGKERTLSSDKAVISRLGLRLQSPQIEQVTGLLQNAPFISLELTVRHPSERVPPFVVRSTVTPTFSYGDQRE